MSGARREARDLDEWVDRIERLVDLKLTDWQRGMLKTILPEGPPSPMHSHLFALHRHPDWHGHCDRFPVGLSRSVTAHSCRRWHFHGPFRHRHTETGR